METLTSTSDVSILQAVADPIRYRIVRRLLESPATQKQLAAELRLSSGTISKQMAKLAAVHLVHRPHSHGSYELRFQDDLLMLLRGYTNLKKTIASALAEDAEREHMEINRAGVKSVADPARREGA